MAVKDNKDGCFHTFPLFMIFVVVVFVVLC